MLILDNMWYAVAPSEGLVSQGFQEKQDAVVDAALHTGREDRPWHAEKGNVLLGHINQSLAIYDGVVTDEINFPTQFETGPPCL